MSKTSTEKPDPIELEALATVYREHTDRTGFCAIGSVKSNLGHTSAAAGIASIQKVLLCMRNEQLVPTLHFDWQYWFLVVALWIVFAGAWLLFAILGRALHWSRARIGAITLGCGLGNTAFIGFPMIVNCAGSFSRGPTGIGRRDASSAREP